MATDFPCARTHMQVIAACIHTRAYTYETMNGNTIRPWKYSEVSSCAASVVHRILFGGHRTPPCYLPIQRLSLDFLYGHIMQWTVCSRMLSKDLFDTNYIPCTCWWCVDCVLAGIMMILPKWWFFYDPTVHYNILPLSLSSLLQNLIFAQNFVIAQEIKIRIEQIT